MAGDLFAPRLVGLKIALVHHERRYGLAVPMHVYDLKGMFCGEGQGHEWQVESYCETYSARREEGRGCDGASPRHRACR